MERWRGREGERDEGGKTAQRGRWKGASALCTGVSTDFPRLWSFLGCLTSENKIRAKAEEDYEAMGTEEPLMVQDLTALNH